MKEIKGIAKTVREILKDQRYSIDYYQREYRWDLKQIRELLEDLTDQFNKSYTSGDARQEVQNYEHYFLGSIIFSRRDGGLFIVDGQQRLTSLTLLLILLHRLQGGRSDRVKLEELIFSERYGTKSFNIDVPDRSQVMEAIFSGEIPDVSDQPESLRTIVARYQDLEEMFSHDDIDEGALPYFCDWLIDNVHLVEIIACTDEDAYTIFETMNDRGLSLTPLDMLKGYLLSNIKDPQKRTTAAKLWRNRVEALRKLGKDEESDAVKAWLRARYAQSMRERHRGAENADFERIGTEFHRWVGDRRTTIGLTSGDDFFHFVNDEFDFYSKIYERIRKASETETQDLESVYHVASFRFGLQYPLLLAPLLPSDNKDIIDRKIRLVARFLDILVARRAVNFLSMTVAAMSYAAWLILKDIRGKSLAELAPMLYAKLNEQGCDFDGTSDGRREGFSRFELNHWSKHYIKILLARMTCYVEIQSGEQSSLSKYLVGGQNRYEVEHIWADKYERHHDEFDSLASFAEQRNSIGGLLLLPKPFNASYGKLPYVSISDPNKGKLPHYLTQNLLARSLHPQCYEHNPGFVRFVGESGLPFKPHVEFKTRDMEERRELYRQLAKTIWNPELLFAEAEQ